MDSTPTSTISLIIGQNGKFEGKPPPQIRKRQTDVEFEFIPRAIYNDFYAELQLREEGFSGKVNWSRKRIKQRIETNPQDIPDSLNLQSKALISSKMNQSDAVTEEDNVGDGSDDNLEANEERTVILTEAGIDILNFTYRNAIPPLLKPKISSPLERPIHHFDNNRGVFRQFDKTYRYGSFLNTLSSIDFQTLNYCHVNGADMEKKREQSHRAGTLRYKQAFKASESTVRARGLSFRGRGLLDVRKGWAKASEYAENGITGDITDMSYKSEFEPISFIGELGHPAKPQFTAASPSPQVNSTLSVSASTPRPTGNQNAALLETTPESSSILKSSIVDQKPQIAKNDIEKSLSEPLSSIKSEEFKLIIKSQSVSETPPVGSSSILQSSLNDEQKSTVMSPSMTTENVDIMSTLKKEFDGESVDLSKKKSNSVASFSTKEDEEWLAEQKKKLFVTRRTEPTHMDPSKSGYSEQELVEKEAKLELTSPKSTNSEDEQWLIEEKNRLLGALKIPEPPAAILTNKAITTETPEVPSSHKREVLVKFKNAVSEKPVASRFEQIAKKALERQHQHTIESPPSDCESKTESFQSQSVHLPTQAAIKPKQEKENNIEVTIEDNPLAPKHIVPPIPPSKEELGTAKKHDDENTSPALRPTEISSLITPSNDVKGDATLPLLSPFAHFPKFSSEKESANLHGPPLAVDKLNSPDILPPKEAPVEALAPRRGNRLNELVGHIEEPLQPLPSTVEKFDDLLLNKKEQLPSTPLGEHVQVTAAVGDQRPSSPDPEAVNTSNSVISERSEINEDEPEKEKKKKGFFKSISSAFKKSISNLKESPDYVSNENLSNEKDMSRASISSKKSKKDPESSNSNENLSKDKSPSKISLRASFLNLKSGKSGGKAGESVQNLPKEEPASILDKLIIQPSTASSANQTQPAREAPIQREQEIDDSNQKQKVGPKTGRYLNAMAMASIQTVPLNEVTKEKHSLKNSLRASFLGMKSNLKASDSKQSLAAQAQEPPSESLVEKLEESKRDIVLPDMATSREERPILSEPTTQSVPLSVVAIDEQITFHAADKIQKNGSSHNDISSSALSPAKENVLNIAEQKAFSESQPEPPLAQITLKDKSENNSNLDLKEPPLPQKEALSKEDPETWLSNTQKIVWKDHKCDLKISNFELHCCETGKNKPYKPYLPLSLRRVLRVTLEKGADVEIQCTIPRGDKEGSEYKTISITFSNAKTAQEWKNNLLELSFGGTYEETSKREILILAEKSDKDSQKLVEKYMLEIFGASKRPYTVKSVQYNEFMVTNTLSSMNFQNIGNVILTNPDFVPRLQQVLVREQYSIDPVNLTCEKDPVDAAVDIVRSAVGKKKLSTVHVTGLQIKRDDKGIFASFRK